MFSFILRNQIGIRSRSVSTEQLHSCLRWSMNLGEFFFHVFSLFNKIRRHEKEREIQGKFIEAQRFCCVTRCDGAHPKLPLSAPVPTQRKKKVPHRGLMVTTSRPSSSSASGKALKRFHRSILAQVDFFLKKMTNIFA